MEGGLVSSEFFFLAGILFCFAAFVKPDLWPAFDPENGVSRHE